MKGNAFCSIVHCRAGLTVATKIKGFTALFPPRAQDVLLSFNRLSIQWVLLGPQFWYHLFIL